MDAGFKLKNENPKDKANIISKLFYAWMIKLFYKGTRKGLEVSDLYQIETSNSSESLTDKLESNWNNELHRAKLENRKPKLLKVILKTFLCSYMISGILIFIQHVGLRSYQPAILSNLISLFKNPNEDNSQAMYIAASTLVSISICVIFLMHHVTYSQAAVGMRMRIALSSLIYRKVLRLNKKSLGQTAIGQIVNLLSNDVNRFDMIVLSLHYLWIMPFQIVFVTYLIWQEVGVSALAGVLSMAILTLPVQGYLAKLTSSLRFKVAHLTDRRVTLMSEIISGIQVIKMYAWEKPFQKMVEKLRLKEIKALITTSYLRGIYLSSMVFTERVTLFFTVICHVLLGNVILAEQVFSLAQFFSLLQLTMSIFYPLSITYGAETLVSIKRLENFLFLEENEETVVGIDFLKGVLLKEVQASWVPSKVVLNDLNLNIPPGSLCVIIGPVGAGKSSLLYLLLGELRPDYGSITIEGTVSYFSQESWLFPSTIRSNILFGENYNKQLYNKVVKVCALQKDFDQLPLGDQTMVGERGAALSGGQKARVSLARAVYRQADVYLLDDPLSAVDGHVGKHLFDECIMKFLRGKTRILVTHQLRHLKKADLIVVIDGGKIQAQGTFRNLCKDNVDFSNMLVSSENNEDKKYEMDVSFEQKPPNTSLMISNSLVLDSVDLQSGSLLSEEMGMGNISPFKEYVKAAGSCCSIFALVIIFVLGQAACSGADYWVTYWTQQEALKHSNLTIGEPITEKIEYYPDNSNISSFGNTYYTIYKKNFDLSREKTDQNNFIDKYLAIYIYAGLIVAVIVITLSRSFLFFKLAMNASKNLHKKMFHAILQAPMRFFNTNPTGRILNRFSKDMGAIDEHLPKVLLESIQITLVMFGILVMVSISNFYMIFVMMLLGAIFLKLRSWFVITAKDIKHLEGITKSPVFSHLNSSLHGITTIRAFNAEEMLKKEFDHHQDVHTSAWNLSILCMVAFGLWLDIVCVLFIGCTTFSFVILNQYTYVNASLVGLAISQSLVLTGMLQYGTRQSAEVINQLTSVERIMQYTNIEKEGPFESIDDDHPPPNWPKKALLEAKNLHLKYSPESSPVLKNLNFTITPGAKIGIVGRTGAGKSSLISALFRLAILEGDILIDGINTKYIGLHRLRKSIAIIPQEPVLFSSTLRFNLDPFNEYDDCKLWNVLEEVELKEVANSLDVSISGGGSNFSVGQRQLLCLARAILRNNKILILDEATANIDQKTDALIQKTIRRKFEFCTVLTIAHRLDTIMDSDKIIVMERGQIIEFDYPYSLLQKPETTFHKMVLETGLSTSEYLENIALNAFLHRREEDEIK